MGKRKREHRKAVATGKDQPFRASPDKPKRLTFKERIEKLKER